VDTTAPTVSATAIGQVTGSSVDGYVQASTNYYVYANVTDAGSGVATVTANVNNVTTGATAVALSSSGGPFTSPGGTSYTYRSASLTANNQNGGSANFTVNATDGDGNTSSNSNNGSVNFDLQLTVPTSVVVTPSTTTAGAVHVSFAAPSNAPGGQLYTVRACTDSAMTLNCHGPSSFTSGSDFTGLTAGTSYYLTVTATASTGYLDSTSAVPGSTTMATVQLAAISAPTLNYGASAGAVNVTFAAPSNALGGQLYSATACTDSAMALNCHGPSSITSGSDLTGLTFTQGSAGTSYYVTVTAAASTGYLTVTSSTSTSHADTSQVNAPGTPTAAPSTMTAGAVTVTFNSSSGTAPASYSAAACTDTAMSVGCHTQNSFTSASDLMGLTAGTSYYVNVTANPPTGYVAATSAHSDSSTMATVQLNVPTSVVVTPSTTTAGVLHVTYVAPSNVPGGQTYSAKACTDSAMTLNCHTQGSFTSGSEFTTSLTAGTSYYVTVTASVSTGYLASTSAVPGLATMATVQLSSIAAPTLNYGTSAGSLNVTFTAPSNAPGGQSYSAKACTDSAMTLNCHTQSSFFSGSNLTGLTFTQGSAGTSYFVTVTASASNGYLTVTSSTSASHADTSQVNAPTGVTSVAGSNGHGKTVVNFTASTGAAPSSYTCNVFANNSGSIGALLNLGGTPCTPGSNTTISGLGTTGTNDIWVEVVANPPTGYVSATSTAVLGSTD